MIDIRKITYKPVAVLEDGTQLDISRAAEDLGWEEGEGELALRLSFTVHNAKYQGKYLSQLIKPGCVVAIICDWGDGTEEVARGTIVDWDTNRSGSADTFSVLAYDELFSFQQSQDNRYITAGTGTKAALSALFGDWGIPLGEYKGPDVPHAKTLYKNEYLSDITADLLDTAHKQGGPKAFLRAAKGSVSVLPLGGNETIYHFDEDTTLEVTQDKISTQNLVTRVKVVGKEDSSGRQAAEAIIDGKTEYGIRQRIYNRQEDDSLATAKAEAQKIIDEEGEPETSISFQAPDVPPIRKGDKIHAATRSRTGFFLVKSIQHNAANGSMTMGVEPTE
nr:hypothetical protein [uncultured Dysosmobacter sp.]